MRGIGGPTPRSAATPLDSVIVKVPPAPAGPPRPPTGGVAGPRVRLEALAKFEKIGIEGLTRV
jgi:hypothetical protein